MGAFVAVVAAMVVAFSGFAISIHLVERYEDGVLFRFGRVLGRRRSRRRR